MSKKIDHTLLKRRWSGRNITLQNSSNEIFPSPSWSPSSIDLSTICCSCTSVRLEPTIIFNTRNNSPFDMYPSASISYTWNANLSLSSLVPLSLSVLRTLINSENWISSSLFVSKICNIRSSSGLRARSGMERNSLVVRVPLPSLSNNLNLR